VFFHAGGSAATSVALGTASAAAASAALVSLLRLGLTQPAQGPQHSSS
jgi:hypothetical protein